VAHVCGISHVDASAYKSQCTSVFLHRGIKCNAVIVSGGIYVDGPAWVDRACVPVQGENQMLLRSTAIWRGEGIETERARCEIYDGRTGDADRIDVTPPELV